VSAILSQVADMADHFLLFGIADLLLGVALGALGGMMGIGGG
jgi:hypothetical protein